MAWMAGLERRGLAIVLFLGIPLLHTVAVTFWWTSWHRLRLWGYKRYYRFFGPNCAVRIVGQFQVDANLSDKALLGKVLTLAQEINSRAHEDIGINNRSVIRVGAQVLTTTVATISQEEDYNGDGFGPEREAQVEKSIAFDLGGYEGAIARLDDALRKRALPLLLRLNSEIKKQGTLANLSLEARVNGNNPFLTFYLRDVPSSRVQGFHLKIETKKHGYIEMLEVTADTITVAARTPDALIESARGYLASPALAYRG
jgi:hypothetical protein